MFLLSCGFGFLLGVLYDVFRLVRMAWFSQKAVVFFQDVLYFTVCACLTFVFMLAMNYGEVRGYVILGEILGWIIYYYSAGAMVFRVSGKIVGACRKAAAFSFSAISAPFRFAFQIFRGIVKFVVKVSKKIFQKFHVNFRINLKNKDCLLYNHIVSKKYSNAGNHKDDENEDVLKEKKEHYT